MTINDIGPKPQSFNIEDATKENTDYRSVAWSGRYLQVTLSTAERFPAGMAEQKQASGARMGRDAKGPDRAP